MELTESQKRLIMHLQYDFPVDVRPFSVIAEKLGLREREVIEEAKLLMERGVLKRIGMYVNFRAKGMEGALIAANIPPGKIEVFRRTALGIREITHNFVRNHCRFNIWFVMKASNKEELRTRVAEMLSRLEVSDYVILYSKRNLKLSVKYDVFKGISWSPAELAPERVPKAEELGVSTEVLKRLSMPLPITERPFQRVAAEVGMTEEELVQIIGELRRFHVIKDYGATVNGERIGITENAMLLMNSDRVEETCVEVAQKVHEATHVVLRETEGDWEYLCYCMIHGNSRSTLRRVAEEVVKNVPVNSYMMLYSIENLKPGIVM
jgi:DNA-binding Lrp family transcriptional regulator